MSSSRIPTGPGLTTAIAVLVVVAAIFLTISEASPVLKIAMWVAAGAAIAAAVAARTNRSE